MPLPEQILTVILSGAVGSLITLLGVAVQNRANDKRHREQLTHDAEQRRTEREMVLRREIYLEVAEATAKMREYLASFSNSSLSEEERGAILHGSAAAIHRVQIIGTVDTLKAIGEAQDYFAHKAIDFLEKKSLLQLTQMGISELEGKVQVLLQTGEQISKMLVPGSENFGDLLAKWQQSLRDLNLLQDELEKRRQEVIDKQIDLLQTSFTATSGLSKLLVEANILARRELDMKIDEEAYREIASEGGDQLQQHLMEMIKRVKTQVDAS